MLAFNSLRFSCSPRALLKQNVLRTRRQIVYDAMTCSVHCMPTSCNRKDTWRSHTNFVARGKDSHLSCYTHPVSSLRSFCTDQDKLSCWHCEQPLDKSPAFFCMSCKVVQPPEEGMSYFKIMDCTYTFTVDIQKLQRRYLQLQRSLHPDNFGQKSVLELQGMRIEEGTDSEADSEFLMELMEINEALDEARTPEEANKIGKDTKGKLAELTGEIDAVLLKGELQTAKALLAQMKYYANIEEKVKEKLSGFM
ncbi:iron-sulfur cluster co-chaperone protein HscB isoform X2 [Labrus bergylta]|uniref:iron-sulfur cluster co-chaperone protein HscB isoform X2 n=1 Tax=Labrus bergylta TaxID=56723 RepID=UPI0033141F0C